MAVTSPFDEMERMFEEMREAFGNARAGGWSSGRTGVAVDLSRHEDEYVLVADLPGFEREEISLSADGETLRIDATHTVADDGGARSRRVHERVSLPSDVDVEAEAAHATYRNGVLEVHLPFDAEAEGYRIDID